MLGDGPTAGAFSLPPGLVIETFPDALRFRGPANDVARLREEFAKLARSQPGAEVAVGDWFLRVDDQLPERPEAGVIVFPWHVWQMVGILLADAAYGYEPNPVDYSETGSLGAETPPGTWSELEQADIGVIVEGPLLPKR
jgi:hypothetical protein